MSDVLPETGLETERIVCPSCAALIGANEVFCPECNAPISLIANADPLQSIRTEGFLLGKATEGKPKPIVLIGVWVMFFPGLIISALVSFSIIYGGSGTGASGFLFFWGGIGLSVVFAVILFKVTRNYLRKSDANDEQEDQEV
jgi:hypothetical protein